MFGKEDKMKKMCNYGEIGIQNYRLELRIGCLVAELHLK